MEQTNYTPQQAGQVIYGPDSAAAASVRTFLASVSHLVVRRGFVSVEWGVEAVGSDVTCCMCCMCCMWCS